MVKYKDMGGISGSVHWDFYSTEIHLYPYCNDRLSGESDPNSLGKSQIDAIVKNL